VVVAVHFEALYAAAERWPELRARYAVWFDGVRLDSQGAAQAREQQEPLRALEDDRPPPIGASTRSASGGPSASAASRLSRRSRAAKISRTSHGAPQFFNGRGSSGTVRATVGRTSRPRLR